LINPHAYQFLTPGGSSISFDEHQNIWVDVIITVGGKTKELFRQFRGNVRGFDHKWVESGNILFCKYCSYTVAITASNIRNRRTPGFNIPFRRESAGPNAQYFRRIRFGMKSCQMNIIEDVIKS
jgi:hypothetical protein